jgi:thiamine-monophosphate kinase
VQSCPLSKRAVTARLRRPGFSRLKREVTMGSPIGGYQRGLACLAGRLERMKITSKGEEALLSKIRRAARGTKLSSMPRTVALGVGDDAALFRPTTGHDTILTCDWFLEGTHFLREKHPPDSVGWKCLTRALSDVAAMGGSPRCFLLSLALPASHTGRWLDLFFGGLRRASRKFQCVLAGGDTTRNQKILINVTVIGEVPAGRAAFRAGARLGDIVHVSGQLGEAELGLRVLNESKEAAGRSNHRLRKHLYPEPRLALGQWLTKNRIVTAMMDLSDGLSTDLPRLCSASRVGARLESARIPLAPISEADRRRGFDPLHLALQGGDDYELLFTVPRRSTSRIPRSFQGLRLTAIGEITRDRKVLLLPEDGPEQLLVRSGWDPFREETPN